MDQMDKRAKVGRGVSLIGIIANACLSAGKIVIGLGSGSMAVLADGINNFFDTASAIVSLLSFRLASQPSDKEHPFGHARAEYIGSFIISMATLYVAFTLLRQGIDRIINPLDISLSLLEIMLLVLSVFIKVLLFFYYRSTAEKINSDLLRATALDTEGDIITSLLLLFGLIISPRLSISLDGPMTIAVSIMVAKNGWDILTKNFDELLGAMPDSKFINNIRNDIKGYHAVLGVHDIMVHKYGPGNKYVSADVEMAGDWSLVEAHSLVSKIEADIAEKYKISITLHPEPIESDDPGWLIHKERIEKLVLEYGPGFSIRDFQLVRGSQGQFIIFEVAIPWDEKRQMQLVQEELEEITSKAFPNYKIHIHVKRNINDGEIE